MPTSRSPITSRNRLRIGGPFRHLVRAPLKPLLVLLFTALLAAEGSTAAEVESFSNKVWSTGTISDGHLIAFVRTDIYDTPGIPTCPGASPVEHGVVIRQDAMTPTETIEQEILKQVVETARVGPFRIKFLIVVGDCVEAPGLGSFPVATGVRIQQERP